MKGKLQKGDKEMFHVRKVDGFIRLAIDVKGKPNMYGKPKDFNTKAEAEKWIKNSYNGMPWKYEIYEDNKHNGGIK